MPIGSEVVQSKLIQNIIPWFEMFQAKTSHPRQEDITDAAETTAANFKTTTPIHSRGEVSMVRYIVITQGFLIQYQA